MNVVAANEFFLSKPVVCTSRMNFYEWFTSQRKPSKRVLFDFRMQLHAYILSINPLLPKEVLRRVYETATPQDIAYPGGMPLQEISSMLASVSLADFGSQMRSSLGFSELEGMLRDAAKEAYPMQEIMSPHHYAWQALEIVPGTLKARRERTIVYSGEPLFTASSIRLRFAAKGTETYTHQVDDEWGNGR